MTSSDDTDQTNGSEWTHEEWLEQLHIRLGATEELLKNYLSRDEGYFTRLASGTQTEQVENSPTELMEHQRRIVLQHLIHIFRPLKKVLGHIDPDLPLNTIDLLVDELWEIERGGRNRLLIRPRNLGRGTRPSVETSLHRACLVVAYDRMITDGLSKKAAATNIGKQAGLKTTQIEALIKDFHEGGKDDPALDLYRRLSFESGSAEHFIALFHARIAR